MRVIVSHYRFYCNYSFNFLKFSEKAFIEFKKLSTTENRFEIFFVINFEFFFHQSVVAYLFIITFNFINLRWSILLAYK